MIDVGATFQGVEKGGRVFPELGNNIRGSGTGVPSVWVGYVGDDTTHREVFGQILQHDGPQDDGTVTLEGGCYPKSLLILKS